MAHVLELPPLAYWDSSTI